MGEGLLSRTEVLPPSVGALPKHLMGKSLRHKNREWSCNRRGRDILVWDSYSTAGIPNLVIDSPSHKSLPARNSSMGFNISEPPAKPSIRIGYVLDSCEDEYGGVIVNSDRLPNVGDFGFILRASLSNWKSKGKKGVWLKLPLERSELVPIAVKGGFRYHHAEPEYVMLTYWIPKGPSMLPANASHQVGVGAFVINDKNEVLVVKEKYCTSASASSWKLPTGFINEAEEIFDGVVREVQEETGINTEFLEVIAFRHAHCVSFKKSDLFFICMLRPLSTHIEVDGFEIQAAKWMPLDEFIEQPLIQADDMFRKITDICTARLARRYCGLTTHRLTSKFDGKFSSLYYNVSEAEDLCQGE